MLLNRQLQKPQMVLHTLCYNYFVSVQDSGIIVGKEDLSPNCVVPIDEHPSSKSGRALVKSTQTSLIIQIGDNQVKVKYFNQQITG